MLRQLTTPQIANLFCIVFSITISVILFYYYRERTAIRWLSISYLMITMACLNVFLLSTRLIMEVPHFYRTGYIFALLYLPCSYLYVRTSLSGRAPGKWDLLYLLPAVFYVLDYSPFFFTSAEHKIAIMTENFKYPNTVLSYSEGFIFGQRFYATLIGITPLAYWIAQARILVRTTRMNPILRTSNSYWIKWIIFYLTFQLVIMIPIFLLLFTSDVQHFFRVSYVFSIISCSFIALTFFTHPGLPEGQNANFVLPSREKTAQLESYANGHNQSVKPLQHLTKKQITQMKLEIEALLNRTKPYLRHGYSLQEMATSLSYPLYQLSALINQEYATNFNELINKYRVEYAVQLMKGGKVSNLNINGLANECGFNNRNSFTAAFKKFTGLTPSEYIKSLDQ